MAEPRKVKRVQSNAVVLDKNGKDSFLEFPPASLVEFDGKRFTFYAVGYRPLTAEERAIVDGEPKDAKQDEIDVLSDGSTMYYRRKRYYAEKDADYLFAGHGKGKRLYHEGDKRVIRDPAVQGRPELVYELS